MRPPPVRWKGFSSSKNRPKAAERIGRGRVSLRLFRYLSMSHSEVSPLPDVPEEHKRRILTFMKRSSAMTTSQKQGLEQYGSRFLLHFQDGTFDPVAVFGRIAP